MWVVNRLCEGLRPPPFHILVELAREAGAEEHILLALSGMHSQLERHFKLGGGVVGRGFLLYKWHSAGLTDLCNIIKSGVANLDQHDESRVSHGKAKGLCR